MFGRLVRPFPRKMVFLHTAKNPVISPNFLGWKFCGKAQFLHSFGRIARNYAETVPVPQNFHTTKLGEITGFFAVTDMRNLLGTERMHGFHSRVNEKNFLNELTLSLAFFTSPTCHFNILLNTLKEETFAGRKFRDSA